MEHEEYEKQLNIVQMDIDSVNDGMIVDKQKLMNIEIDKKELGDLLNDIYQLITGFALDETWSEWDESVRRRVVDFQYKLLGK